MISIKRLNEKDIDLCYELDSKTISLWSKKQWYDEFKKEGVNIFALLLANLVVGVCVFQVVLDEAQINYFVVSSKYRGRGFGSNLMRFIINKCEKLNLDKLLLEVSQSNLTARKFYSKFDFSTVGIREDYYNDGSDALLKEKKISNKIIDKFNCADNQNA